MTLIAKIKHQKKHPDGYVLPLAIITGMILVVGAAIVSARSFSGMIRWGQQKHRDEAIEIAEAGVAIILNKLNNDYPYLLVEDCDLDNNDCSAWNTQTVSVTGGPSSACPGRKTDPSMILSKLIEKYCHLTILQLFFSPLFVCRIWTARPILQSFSFGFA